MQPPYFIPATQCVLHLALRCVGQAAYKLLRSTSATSSKSIKTIKNKFIPCIIPRRRIRKKKNRSTTLITCRG